MGGEGDGAVVGLHPGAGTLPVQAAPPGAAGVTTIRAAIIPFACWRVDDVRFELDSSIVLPDAKGALEELARLVKESTTPAGDKPPLSVFGHADPVGKDAYNKTLAGRRATAVYGLLTRRVELWEELWTHVHGGDSWEKKKALTTYLAALGYGDDLAERKRFQQDHGLDPDGKLGPKSRAALFRAYMDALSPLACAPEDFLGRGKDPGGKADYQGCGELNPAVLVGTGEEAELGKAGIEEVNGANRRVMVFLFRPGTTIDPARWPCPRAREDSAGCNARLWSDGEARRRPAAERRRFVDSKDTFACRFYHRLADRSPCEGVLPALSVRLYDAAGDFMPRAPFRVTAGDVVRTGVTDPRGFAVARFAALPPTVTIAWSAGPADAPPAPDADLEWTREVSTNVPANDSEDASLVRLRHLGYTKGGSVSENVYAFQLDYRARFGLDPDGRLGPKTRAALQAVHDACGDDLLDAPPTPFDPKPTPAGAAEA